jgi:hypothetical protein
LLQEHFSSEGEPPEILASAPQSRPDGRLSTLMRVKGKGDFIPVTQVGKRVLRSVQMLHIPIIEATTSKS